MFQVVVGVPESPVVEGLAVEHRRAVPGGQIAGQCDGVGPYGRDGRAQGGGAHVARTGHDGALRMLPRQVGVVGENGPRDEVQPGAVRGTGGLGIPIGRSHQGAHQRTDGGVPVELLPGLEVDGGPWNLQEYLAPGTGPEHLERVVGGRQAHAIEAYAFSILLHGIWFDVCV